jgi:hypothetical protein
LPTSVYRNYGYPAVPVTGQFHPVAHLATRSGG